MKGVIVFNIKLERTKFHDSALIRGGIPDFLPEPCAVVLKSGQRYQINVCFENGSRSEPHILEAR